jgi:hypothetical protein
MHMYTTYHMVLMIHYDHNSLLIHVHASALTLSLIHVIAWSCSFFISNTFLYIDYRSIS